MTEAMWTRRDIPKLIGLIIVLSLVAGVTVPTISYKIPNPMTIPPAAAAKLQASALPGKL